MEGWKQKSQGTPDFQQILYPQTDTPSMHIDAVAGFETKIAR